MSKSKYPYLTYISDENAWAEDDKLTDTLGFVWVIGSVDSVYCTVEHILEQREGAALKSLCPVVGPYVVLVDDGESLTELNTGWNRPLTFHEIEHAKNVALSESNSFLYGARFTAVAEYVQHDKLSEEDLSVDVCGRITRFVYLDGVEYRPTR